MLQEFGSRQVPESEQESAAGVDHSRGLKVGAGGRVPQEFREQVQVPESEQGISSGRVDHSQTD